MTVQELIVELQKFPAESEVLFEGDAGYCSIRTVENKPHSKDVVLTTD